MNAIASISQSALSYNLSIVKHHAPNAQVVAMVKANGYGHHLDLITPLINNADLLAVSKLSEAVILRRQTALPIVLLSGVYSKHELQQAIALNCQIVVHDITQLSIIQSTKHSINIWIKINTGMNRLGLSDGEYKDCLIKFKHNPLINIVSIMSHFACADEPNHPMNTTQLQHFKRLSGLTGNTIKQSMANSAAILTNIAPFDFVRPGIMLYGASPFADNHHKLKPVMHLSAPILSIKTLQAGQSVGYGATWNASKQTTLATIGIGYGDGYPRHAKTGTPVLINGVICSLVGRVSMDLICVDIQHTNAKIGDKAVLWGDKQLRVESVASFSNTISYELLSGVSARVKFVSCA